MVVDRAARVPVLEKPVGGLSEVVSASWIRVVTWPFVYAVYVISPSSALAKSVSPSFLRCTLDVSAVFEPFVPVETAG
jgi:hypothetical protein